MNYKKGFLLFRLVVLVAVFLAGFLVGRGAVPTTSTPTSQNAIVAEKSTARLMIDFENGTVKTFEIPLATSTTLASLVEDLNTQGKIKLTSKDYGGTMGLFIQTIDGVPAKTQTDKWWQFWVNNKYSTVGVSSLTITPGDIIEFKFITGQEQNE